MHYRKSNKPKLLLMLVALLALFAISVGVTFSWIEGGATYTIQTDDENQPVKTDSVPDSVTYSGKIKLDPTKNATLELVKYDENTNQYQNLYFSPVSSADGENFLFPVNSLDGKKTVFYREANINDVGTKYINFDFDITDTAKKCFVAFNGEPTITAKRGTSVIDSSAFRIMIKCGGEKRFFTTADTNQTSTVVTGTDGSTNTLTAVPFTAFLNNANKSNKLFTFAKGAEGTIEVSVWLDDGSDTSKLEGCEITIDMELIVVAEDVTATFSAVTYDKTGKKLSAGFTGGSIREGSTSHNSMFSITGTSFTATAEPKSAYDFMGWYSDPDCTTRISDKHVLPDQTPDDDVNYYAKFQERNATTIYVEERSNFKTYSLYVYNDNDYGSDTHYYSDGWPGSTATLDSDTGYYKYEFTTTDVGKFYAIISNKGADSGRYPASGVEGLEGNIGGSYLFTSDNKLIEFDPADMITVNAYGSNGGSGTVNDTSSVLTREGKTIALKATPNTNYKFVGWYKDSSFTTPIDMNSTTASQNITLTAADAGKTLNFYAKFEKLPTVTLKTSVTPTAGGKAYVNSNTTLSGVQVGSSVKLSATANSGYRFAGWYTNLACTTTTGITNPTSATSATYKVSGTDGATVTLYAKFIKTYTVKAVAGTGGTVSVDKSTVDTGGSAKFTATANGGYEFVGWFTSETATSAAYTDNPHTVSNITSNTTLYARFEKTAKTIDVGVIYYLKENNTINQVYYWCDDGTSGTINLSSLTATTRNYSVGSSYWSGAAQKFYCYTIEVPDNVTGIKFKNSSGSWFGGDVKNFEDGKIELIFEYSGAYHNYRTTK